LSSQQSALSSQWIVYSDSDSDSKFIRDLRFAIHLSVNDRRDGDLSRLHQLWQRTNARFIATHVRILVITKKWRMGFPHHITNGVNNLFSHNPTLRRDESRLYDGDMIGTSSKHVV